MVDKSFYSRTNIALLPGKLDVKTMMMMMKFEWAQQINHLSMYVLATLVGNIGRNEEEEISAREPEKRSSDAFFGPGTHTTDGHIAAK